MDATESGMVTEVSAVDAKATTPMNVTESPMVTEVSAVSRKAFCARNSAGQPVGSLDEWGGGREERTLPMNSTLSGILTDESV